MRRLIALSCLSLSVCAAETIVPGGPVSGEWTAEGSPYLILQDIFVLGEDSLRLLPGTVVEFQGYHALHVGGWFQSAGTAEEPILITGPDVDATAGWRGLRLADLQTDTFSLAFTTIENVRQGQFSYGALSILNCSARLDNCIIRDNVADGMYTSTFGTIIATGCVFTNNRGEVNFPYGMACYIGSGEFLAQHCRFIDNFALIDGGAILSNYGRVRLEHCEFENNSCNLWGGALSFAHGSISAYDCRFFDCSGSQGGAAYIAAVDSAIFDRCLFQSCEAGIGSAIHVPPSFSIPLIVKHCNFISNASGSTAVVDLGLQGRIYNSLFVDNTGAVIAFNGELNQVDHCDFFPRHNELFQGVAPPELAELDRVNINGDSTDAYGNLFLDPLFVAADSGDFHLRENSPCIDAGDPESPQDPDQTIADIGMYFYEQEVATQPNPPGLVYKFEFYPVSPNPFNPSTTLRFELREADFVTLKIYDLTGREVSTLVNAPLARGNHALTWNASSFSSGTYYAVLTANARRAVQKLLLVK